MKTYHYFLLMPVLVILAACSSATKTPIEELGISVEVPTDFSLVREDGNEYSGSTEKNIYAIANRQGDPVVELYEINTEEFEEGGFDYLAAQNPTLDGAKAAIDTLGEGYSLYENSENDCGNYVVDYETEEFYYVFGVCEVDDKVIFCGTYPEASSFYTDMMMEMCESVKPL